MEKIKPSYLILIEKLNFLNLFFINLILISIVIIPNVYKKGIVYYSESFISTGVIGQSPSLDISKFINYLKYNAYKEKFFVEKIEPTNLHIYNLKEGNIIGVKLSSIDKTAVSQSNEMITNFIFNYLNSDYSLKMKKIESFYDNKNLNRDALKLKIESIILDTPPMILEVNMITDNISEIFKKLASVLVLSIILALIEYNLLRLLHKPVSR